LFNVAKWCRSHVRQLQENNRQADDLYRQITELYARLSARADQIQASFENIERDCESSSASAPKSPDDGDRGFGCWKSGVADAFLPGHNLISLTAANVDDCKRLCNERKPDCRSVDFSAKRKECAMNRAKGMATPSSKLRECHERCD